MEALTQEMMMMNGGGAAAAANMRARGQHTQVFTDESQNCIVRLHQTNIVTVRQNGDLVLSSGGWRTHQTLKGINTALKTFSPGMQVLPDGHVAEGAWRVSNGSGWSAPFADGITLPGVGPVNLAAQAAQIPGYFEQMSLGFDASKKDIDDLFYLILWMVAFFFNALKCAVSCSCFAASLVSLN